LDRGNDAQFLILDLCILPFYMIIVWAS